MWGPAPSAPGRASVALQGHAARPRQAHAIEAWDSATSPPEGAPGAFGIDEAAVKPHFPRRRDGAGGFDCAQRLFGLRRAQARDPRLPPRRQGLRCTTRRVGSSACSLHDNFACPSKRSGAWMSSYRGAVRQGGAGVLPIVVNNNNFAKGRPASRRCLSLRGRDDAVPRVRPRPARAALGRDLRAAVRHQRAARLRRAAVAIFEHWLRDPACWSVTRATTGTGD